MKKSTRLTTIAFLFLLPGYLFAQPTLASLEDFALFTAAGAFNVTGAGTVVEGDVGTDAGAFNAFPPGTLIGDAFVADATSATANTDVQNLYFELDNWGGPPPCQVTAPGLGNGQTLTPGLYCIGGAATLNGNLTFDGAGLYIIQIDGAFATGQATTVTLINGATVDNIFWQVNGQFDLGNFSTFRGTLVANGAINLLEGSVLLGRGLSVAGAITLANNVVVIQTDADLPIAPNLGVIPTLGQWGMILLALFLLQGIWMSMIFKPANLVRDIPKMWLQGLQHAIENRQWMLITAAVSLTVISLMFFTGVLQSADIIGVPFSILAILPAVYWYKVKSAVVA